MKANVSDAAALPRRAEWRPPEETPQPFGPAELPTEPEERPSPGPEEIPPEPARPDELPEGEPPAHP